MDAIDATDATTKLSTARKIWDLFTSAERRSAVVLLGMMLIGMMQTQSTQ